MVKSARSPARKIILLGVIFVFVTCVLCALAWGVYEYNLTYKPAAAPKRTVYFEPDLARMKAPPTREDLELTIALLVSRFSRLGYNAYWFKFDVTDDGRIRAQVPVEMDPAYIELAKRPGVLEVVDFGGNPVPLGTRIETDILSGIPEDGKIWHTILSGSDIQISHITNHLDGDSEFELLLNPWSSPILAEYTSKNLSSHLGVLMDKEVILLARIDEPILNGRLVIHRQFKKQSDAIAFTKLLPVFTLPIPLK